MDSKSKSTERSNGAVSNEEPPTLIAAGNSIFFVPDKMISKHIIPACQDEDPCESCSSARVEICHTGIMRINGLTFVELRRMRSEAYLKA